MKVKGINLNQLRAALIFVNKVFNGNVKVKSIRYGNHCKTDHNFDFAFVPESEKELKVHSFTLRVIDSRGIGAAFSQTLSSRHTIGACWHVHGLFIDRLIYRGGKIYDAHEKRWITAYDENWNDHLFGAPFLGYVYHSELCECDENLIILAKSFTF